MFCIVRSVCFEITETSFSDQSLMRAFSSLEINKFPAQNYTTV